MPKSERYQSLAGFYDNFTRLGLCINSSQTEYQVDIRSLHELARFLGFGEVKILSSSVLLPNQRNIGQITSVVTDLETANLPPKAKWRKIELYLDIERISESLEVGFTEYERATRIEELIKEELERKGSKNLQEFNLEALVFGDFAEMIVAITLIALCLEFYDLAKPKNRELLLMGAMLFKQLLSAIDTLVHYQSTKFGARFSALEATLFINHLILRNKLDSTQIIRLKPKTSRV